MVLSNKNIIPMHGYDYRLSPEGVAVRYVRTLFMCGNDSVPCRTGDNMEHKPCGTEIRVQNFFPKHGTDVLRTSAGRDSRLLNR